MILLPIMHIARIDHFVLRWIYCDPYDTDILGGDENRTDAEHGSHLTETGQIRAGLMWFAVIWNFIIDERNI